jgi:Ca2+-transporting ATPase
VKGAPEKVLEASTRIQKETVSMLGKEERAVLEREIRKMASEGLRVIGIAYKKVESKDLSPEKVERDLTFLGLVGMQDPPRKEVKEAVEKCKTAGIRVVMVTGDHKETAVSVARELGILEGLVLTGSELDGMNDDDLEKVVEKVSVYARVSPEHKFRIVRALKRAGHVVAVTGDGVNDAPALKEADVGVSMGVRGTDVAREASDIVLTDDNFYSIVAAVEEGRAIYDNIRKFIRFMLSVNFNEIFATSLAILANLPLPLLPLQILWINLLTDSLPALALVFDQKDPEIMKRKPRNPKESILHGMKLFILAAGSLACLATIGSFVFGFITAGELKGRTMALTTAVLFQLLFVFNCRSEKNPVFKTKIFSNKYLVLSVLAALLLQLIIVFVPFFNTLFSTVPLNSTELLIVLLLSSSGLLLFPNIFMS